MSRGHVALLGFTTLLVVLTAGQRRGGFREFKQLFKQKGYRNAMFGGCNATAVEECFDFTLTDTTSSDKFRTAKCTCMVETRNTLCAADETGIQALLNGCRPPQTSQQFNFNGGDGNDGGGPLRRIFSFLGDIFRSIFDGASRSGGNGFPLSPIPFNPGQNPFNPGQNPANPGQLPTLPDQPTEEEVEIISQLTPAQLTQVSSNIRTMLSCPSNPIQANACAGRSGRSGRRRGGRRGFNQQRQRRQGRRDNFAHLLLKNNNNANCQIAQQMSECIFREAGLLADGGTVSTASIKALIPAGTTTRVIGFIDACDGSTSSVTDWQTCMFETAEEDSACTLSCPPATTFSP